MLAAAFREEHAPGAQAAAALAAANVEAGAVAFATDTTPSPRVCPLGETDLSKVLPEPGWASLPNLLDFVYDERMPQAAKEPREPLVLFVAADTLQICALF